MLERQKTRREVQTLQDRTEEWGAITLLVPYGLIRCPAETIMRISDWARWARPRLGLDAHGRCASAEGRYESGYPDAERNIRLEVDLNAVLQVERVVTRLQKKSKDIVVSHFVKGDEPFAIAFRLAIPKARYGYYLKKSILMIKNNLTRV